MFPSVEAKNILNMYNKFVQLNKIVDLCSSFEFYSYYNNLVVFVKIKTLTKNIVMGTLLATTIFSLLFVLSHFILKLLFLMIVLGVGIAVLLPFIRFKKFLNSFLIGIMLVSISFCVVEFSMFKNTGVYSPFVSSPSILLTLSLEQTVKTIENSATFAFLQLEYSGGLSLNSIEFNGPILGYVSIRYYAKNTNTEIIFSANEGKQYTVRIRQFDPSLIDKGNSINHALTALRQIDFLGLEWFYNRSLTIIQNENGLIPTIDALSVSMVNENSNYQDFALTLIGYKQSVKNSGLHLDSVLIASFQPNGNLIYVS